MVKPMTLSVNRARRSWEIQLKILHYLEISSVMHVLRYGDCPTAVTHRDASSEGSCDAGSKTKNV